MNSSRRWWALGALVLSVLVIGFDTTSSSNVRITRMAISPRLATRTLPNMGAEGYVTRPG